MEKKERWFGRRISRCCNLFIRIIRDFKYWFRRWNKEFCLTYGEVAEAYEAWRKKKDDLGEELADVAIYLLGLSEILNIDLEDEILKKVYKNSKREYKVIDGVNTRTKEFNE